MEDLIDILHNKVDKILVEIEQMKKQIAVLKTNQQIVLDITKNHQDVSAVNNHSGDETNFMLFKRKNRDARKISHKCNGKKNETEDIVDTQTKSRNNGGAIANDKFNEDKSYLRELVKNFMESSTLHRFTRLTYSSPWIRILWLLAMAGAIAAMALQINGLARDYLQYNVITDVTVEQAELTFPVVTVCNNRPYSTRKILSLPFFANFSPNIGTSTSRQLLNSYDDLSPKDISYLGANVSETLGHFTYPTDGSKVDTLKYQGSCFSIEAPVGTQFLTLVFNLHLNDSISKYNTEPGIATYLKESLDESPLFGHLHVISTAAGKETFTLIAYDVVNRLNGSYGQCQDNEHTFSERTGMTYEQDACTKECVFRHIISKCQCLYAFEMFFPFWPEEEIQDLTICISSNKFSSCGDIARFDNVSCLCKPRCRTKLYRQVMQRTTDLTTNSCRDESKLELPPICNLVNKLAPTNVSKDWIRKNLAASIIMLSNQPFKIYTQRPEYPILHFLADLGGTMGFYLGASMLTYFEFVQLLISMSFYLIQTLRRKLLYK